MTDPATTALPVRFPGAQGTPGVKTLAAALRGRHILVNEADLFLAVDDGVWQVTPARPDDLAAQLLAAIGADLTSAAELNNGRPVRWDDTIPPGGYVCAVPGGDGTCGYPVESEPCNRHGRDLREGIRVLLADVEKSANATRPSKKTHLEDEFAIALRKLLEEA